MVDEEDDFRGERAAVAALLLAVMPDFKRSLFFVLTSDNILDDSQLLPNLHPPDSLESVCRHLPCDWVNLEVP